MMHKPRLIIIQSYSEVQVSSAASHSYELIQALKKNEMNVKIIKPEKKKSFMGSILFVKSIIKKLDEESDIIYTRSLRLAYILSFSIINKRIPIIVEVNGIWSEEHGPRPIVRYLEKKALKKADKIITVAPQIAKYYIQQGQDKDKIHIIENGVNIEKFKPIPNAKKELCDRLGIPVESPIILFVGELYAWQGVDQLIHSMTHLIKKVENAKLLIVGFGREELRLKSLTKKLGLNNNILFLGRKKHDDIPKIISASDVCVSLLSTSKFGSLKMWEYLACEIPVVATNIEGYQFIKTEKCGILVNHCDVEDAAQAIFTIINNHESAEIMGKNGRNYILKGHTWDNTARKLDSVIHSLVNERQ